MIVCESGPKKNIIIIIIIVQLAPIQCVAPVASNNLQSGLSSASSVASSTVCVCGMIGRSSLWPARRCEDVPSAFSNHTEELR